MAFPHVPGRRISLPANTKYLYNICTLTAQRLRRWSNFVQMLYENVLRLPCLPAMLGQTQHLVECTVFAGSSLYQTITVNKIASPL